MAATCFTPCKEEVGQNGGTACATSRETEKVGQCGDIVGAKIRAEIQGPVVKRRCVLRPRVGKVGQNGGMVWLTSPRGSSYFR
jgi:hypothetical protein